MSGLCFSGSVLPKLLLSVVLILLFVLAPSGFAYAQMKQNDKECVIILHGLARTKHSMQKVENALSDGGYVTVNAGYPSTNYSIETLAVEVVSENIKTCRKENSDTIHFVTHSLGGILVRQYLATHTMKDLGRVVMLSPPNHGSEIVDKLGWFFLFQLINGPAGDQLGTSQESGPSKLGPADFDLGIITGSRSFNPLYSSLVPGADDGKVSVESARLEGMNDFLIVPHSHSFLMNSDVVIENILNYLKEGHFLKE